MRVAAKYSLSDESRARLDRISAAIMQSFADGGYERIDLPVLQPADLYLDMAGEDIREKMFVFDDPLGNEMCLRADLTIPLCCYVLDHKQDFPARHSCIGAVFRFDAEASAATEMLQAGAECLGELSSASGDYEMLDLACRALSAAGAHAVAIKLSDVSLFPTLLSELRLDDVWQRHLAYAFRHPSLLPSTLADLKAGNRPKAPRFALDFSRATRAEAEVFVSERIGIAHGEEVSGRSAADIAARLIDRAKAAATPLPDVHALQAIDAFLGIDGPAGQSIRKLKSLAQGERFLGAVSRIESCVDRLRASSGADRAVDISTTLGRSFTYYTGFVFTVNARGEDEPLAAGGRYDRLLSDLGARAPISAVGCAIWPERILAAEVPNA